ncbi:MAG: T9SS type A sorting domain-containing protein [Candidatus Latescibacteria bacterium]|nr:T9SS type A sorting domain-containing protein [Candidatus Latescibacterota bacterium]
MKRIQILVLFFILSISFHKDTFADGVWNYFTQPDEINGIAIDGNFIWCNTSGGVVRWDKRDGSYVKYTAGDGLLKNGGTPISIGLDGLVWCGYGGYSDGVSYFDGNEWVNFRPTGGISFSNDFRDIAVDKNGAVWFGTYSGILYYKNGNWVNYNGYNSEVKNRVKTVAVDHDGVIWCGYGYNAFGVSSFDGEQWNYYASEAGLDTTNVFDIYVDKDNTKWFTSSNVEIISFDGTVWKTWTTEDGLDDIKIYRVTGDNNGVLWLGTENGISSFDGSNYVNYPFEGELSDQYTSAIAVDDDNNVWCGTKKGLACFDGTGWKIYKESGGPNGFRIENIFFDNNENKWISYDAPAYGFTRFDGNQWYHYADIPSGINNLNEGNDNIKWFMTNLHIYSYDDIQWTEYSIENSKDIAIGQDNVVWIGGSNGIYSFDGEVWNQYTRLDYGINSTIYHCLVDRKNIKWFGFKSKGIVSFDGETWNNYTSDDGLLASDLTVIEVDLNNVKWFGHEAGVSSFDDVAFTDHTQIDGPVSNIRMIKIAPDNTKWFGTEDGLWSFDDQIWHHYSGNELPEGYIRILEVDTDNSVWMRIDNNFSIVHFDGKTAEYFTTENGLIHNSVNTIAIDHDGVKWFGTSDGISTYKDNSITSVTLQNKQPQSIPLITTYPNPFNPSTTIEFTLPESGFAIVTIYSMAGQKIREFAADYMTAGTHTLSWDGKDVNGNTVSSGIYITRLQAGKHTAAGRMVLVR